MFLFQKERRIPVWQMANSIWLIVYHLLYAISKKGRLAQLVRACASHAQGQWFESTTAHQICECKFGTETTLRNPTSRRILVAKVPVLSARS